MEEEETEEKDSQWFSGMKEPHRGDTRKNGPSLKAWKLNLECLITKKKTMFKFLQVREGETQNSGERTVTRSKGNRWNKELAIMHPLRIKQRKRESAISTKNKYIIVQPTERDFDFMRYYGM
jgi:hypothetical protein